MKKFVDVFDASDYEILSDDGFKPLTNVMKTIKYEVHIVSFSDGSIVECADDHIVMTVDDEEVFAKNSVGCMVKTTNGYVRVVSVEPTGKYKHMFDVEMKEHHKFYTNGVLSHNTTIVAAYLLHKAIFTPNYNIALLANKKEQSAEVLDRIKTMYESLPWWLQVGVRRWNVNDIRLDLGKKGSSIFTAATSGSSVRGKSINCIGGNSVVTLKDNESGMLYDLDLDTVYKVLEGDDEIISNSF